MEKLGFARQEFVLEKMQGFLWDVFCDADGVGVDLKNLLSWPGLNLAGYEIESVTAHYYGAGEWSKSDEIVSDAVADATDGQDYDQLYDWLAWSVGDQTAAKLVESWAGEDWGNWAE